MKSLKWTRERLAGLAVFASSEEGIAREGNATEANRSRVYWQVVDWLRGQGLVEPVDLQGTLGTWFRLTTAGRTLADDLLASGRLR